MSRTAWMPANFAQAFALRSVVCGGTTRVLVCNLSTHLTEKAKPNPRRPLPLFRTFTGGARVCSAHDHAQGTWHRCGGTKRCRKKADRRTIGLRMSPRRLGKTRLCCGMVGRIMQSMPRVAAQFKRAHLFDQIAGFGPRPPSIPLASFSWIRLVLPVRRERSSNHHHPHHHRAPVHRAATTV